MLEPILEAHFHPSSFGFRPKRGCKDALREVDRLVKSGHCFVVDADLKGYFDTIPHEGPMRRLETRVKDGRVLDLVRAWLDQDIMAGCRRWTPVGGTPQGAVISPLLANLYLHPLDELMAAHGLTMVRHADDFVVLCDSPEQARAALALIRSYVDDAGLTLHPDKTHVGDCRIKGQGFEFLGYRFEAGRRLVRKTSVLRLRDKIRARHGGRADKASPKRSRRSILSSRGGSATSSTPRRASRTSTRSRVGACGRCCANRRSARDAAPPARTGSTG